MSQDTPSKEAREQFENRVGELMDAGYSQREAVGIASSELQITEELRDWVKYRYDVAPSLAEFQAKGWDAAEDALTKFLLGLGGHRTILAGMKSTHRDAWTYIVSDTPTANNDTSDTPEEIRLPDGEIRIIQVQTGGPSGELAGNISVKTLATYESVGELVQEEYLEADSKDLEQLSKWRMLLIDAGVDEDELPQPGELLPDSHPDSADHHNYQMRSAELNDVHLRG